VRYEQPGRRLLTQQRHDRPQTAGGDQVVVAEAPEVLARRRVPHQPLQVADRPEVARLAVEPQPRPRRRRRAQQLPAAVGRHVVGDQHHGLGRGGQLGVAQRVGALPEPVVAKHPQLAVLGDALERLTLQHAGGVG
jgi:hypothetical protein